jgi:ATP-dependent Lhr-like helicase
MPLSGFHPIIQAWFRGRFQEPTQAQALGWPAIAQGRHTLIAAPTGSGKTLAAFLTCLDRLVRAGLQGEMPESTEVLYVSPLKALSNDIQRNLAEPLAEIQALAEQAGTPLPEIRVAVRTGDTLPAQRRAMAKTPPHILITTPESLFILLTSQSGRRALAGVRTLILDEIHAVADDKRGSHLALSVERLCALAGGPVTRIGLSATQRPIEEMARFLVGSQGLRADGTPDCLIVDTGHARTLDLALELPPGLELGPIATHELWGLALDRIAELARAHRTTLVFVNTRRLVERVAHQLSLRLGEEAVVAHHGSLSRETRLAAEQRLKGGQVQVCVATASLELGIDIGLVDLVCQVGSPRSIGVLIQRVGRSGHSLGATPKGRLFPLTRDELLECTALLRAVRGGNLDRLSVPPWPLDVLGQQIVAACACEEWEEDALYDLCRRAYPYHDLPREKYAGVVEMLSQGIARRWGRGSAYLHRDGVHHRLRARRGARLAALTSGGAIPNNADYDVVAEPQGTLVGTVNEDFAVESMAGDIFLLGNTPWRIRRVEQGRVRVEDAHGSAPTIPFWLGEAPARTTELSQEVSALRHELDGRLGDPAGAAAWLTLEAGIPGDAAEQAVAYLAEGKRVLGAVPTRQRVIAERFFDEAGGTQLVIHSPYGARINRAWGLALRKRLCRTFNFELQASATDDGINISLGPQHSFPLADVFRFLSSRSVADVLLQAVFQAPLFNIRWRWNAARFLAVLRHTGGRKVPMPLQRMRADDLLAAVFPAQLACQDNALAAADIQAPDHPLVFETVRDCLTEALDLEGLTALLRSIEGEEVEVYARDTPQPSVFAHQILNAMPYAFLDDAPLEERRSRAVALRRALPEDAGDLGALDTQAIEAAARDAWPAIRDAHELHDALLTLGVLPEAEAGRGAGGPASQERRSWFEALVADGRALRLRLPDGSDAWVAAESALLVAAAYPDARLEPASLATTHPEILLSPPPEGGGIMPPPSGGGIPMNLETASRSSSPPPAEDGAVVALVRGWAECLGPFTAAELAARLELALSRVQAALARLEGEGLLLRGRFTPGTGDEELCDRRILARIHRATVARLRREVEPVPAAAFLRFLLRWQHAAPSTRLHGDGGLLEVVEQLQGFEAPAASWEAELLPARVADYDPTMLDRLCFSGDVVWGRFVARSVNGETAVPRTPLTRTGPLTLGLREDLPWLLEERSGGVPEFTGAARDVMDFLTQRGASFVSDIVAGAPRLPVEVEDALWQLVAAGLVTADGFGALRGLISGAARRRPRSSPFRRNPRRRLHASRWSLLQTVVPPAHALESRAAQLLRRYGVVFPELLAREVCAPSWRSLLQVFRRAEARGEIRGGRFVAGFVGEQFALPEAVEALRTVARSQPVGALVRLSACDPLNLVGGLTPGPRVTAILGNRVVFQDGVPVAAREGDEVRFIAPLDGAAQTALRALLGPGVSSASLPALLVPAA